MKPLTSLLLLLLWVYWQAANNFTANTVGGGMHLKVAIRQKDREKKKKKNLPRILPRPPAVYEVSVYLPTSDMSGI